MPKLDIDPTTIHPDAVAVQETSNGRIVRDANGRFVKGTQPTNIITPETARHYHQLRRDAYQQAAAEGLARSLGAVDPDLTQVDQVGAPLAAWGVLVGRTAEQVYHSEIPRSDAVRVVGQAIGALSADKDADTGGDVTVGADVRSLLADLADIARAKLSMASESESGE